MRALLAITLLSSSVLADPVPNAGSTTGTPTAFRSGNSSGSGGGATVEITAAKQWQPYTPADHGGFSGIVIVPKPTQDALPYPRGMVIAPPEIGDPMPNLFARSWTWALRSLWQQLGAGVGALLGKLQSSHP